MSYRYFSTKKMRFTSLPWLCAVMFALFSLTAMRTSAQVLVTDGTNTNTYTTLKGAFDAVNSGTFTGNINIGINANTTETVPAVLNSSGAGSASYTSVTINPTSDGVSISGATATGRGVIELNGADNVTINGDNPSTGGTNRDLNIINTAVNTVLYNSVIRVALATTIVTSADNNTFKNLVLIGNATGRNTSLTGSSSGSENYSYGILATGGASTISATAAPSAIVLSSTTIASPATATNLTVNNNSVTSAGRAIAIQGASTTVFPGLQISNNVIGNATSGAANGVYSMGITAQGSANGSIADNTVYVESYVTTGIRGIDVGSISPTGVFTIERNLVNRVLQNTTSGYGAYGINVAAGNGQIIKNNFVSGVRNYIASTFDATYGAQGIRLAAGTGHFIYHNSVNIYGTFSGTTNGISACISIAVNGCDIRNNIFSNTATGGSTSSRHTDVYIPVPPVSTTTINYNAYYYTAASTSAIGTTGTTAPGTNYTTLAAWKAYTSTLGNANNDNASYASQNPAPFTSNTNLHINTGSAEAPNLNGTGANVGVNFDIDADPRGTPPDIGADEFFLAGCSGTPTGGAAVATPSSFTCSGTSNLSLTGQSTGAGITYQWQFTTDGTTYTNIPGATNATYTTTTISSTTGFRAVVTCTSSGQSDNSTTATVTVNPVSAGTAVASPNAVCTGSSSVLSLTGNSTTGVTYQWQSSPDNATWTNISGATSATYTASPTTSTYYRAKVTCTASGASDNSSSALVTVNSPLYAPYNGVSFTEGFETWTSLCGVSDVPSVNWKNTPVAGNNSWRREDQGATASWTSITSGLYSPVSTQGAHSARFHSYDAPSGSTGKLDLYIDMSGGSSANQVKFDYINTSGADVLKVYVSTNGGSTFTQVGTTLATAAAWTGQTFNITSQSATTVIRLEATGDFGVTDIGVDNFKVVVACNVTASINATATSFCAGGTTTLTENGGNAVSWLWSPGDQTTQSITVSPTTTTTYTVTATGVGGCTATASQTVTVFPVPDATASASSNNICQGSSIDLSSSASPYLNPILTTNFNSGLGGWTATNASEIAGSTTGTGAAAWTLRPDGYTYSGTTFHSNDNSQFILTNSDALGSSQDFTNTFLRSPAFSTVGYSTLSLNFYQYFRSDGFTDEADVEVSTNGTTWTVVKSYLSTQGSATGFVSSTVNLNAYAGLPTVYVRFEYYGEYAYYWAIDNVTIAGNSANYTYAWSSTPAGFTSTDQNPTGVTPTESTLYSVTLTNTYGCTATATTGVVVNAPATANAGPNQTICYDGSASVTATIGGSATDGSWSTSGDGTFANANNLTTVYNPGPNDQANQVVQLTFTTDDPSGPCTAASNAALIVISPQLFASATSGTIACNGGTTTITVTGAGGTPPYTGEGTQGGFGAGTYPINITDANGCTASTTITITEPTALVAQATAGTINCNGGTTSVAVGATGGTPPYSGDYGIVTGVSAGQYTYTVIDANGCSDSKTITVSQPSAINVGAVAGTIQCPGGTTSVTVGATGGNPPYSGDGVYTNQSAGQQTYTVTDANGCSASTTIMIADGTGTAPAKPGPITGPYVNLCGGGAFTYSIQPVTGATSYVWTVPAGFAVQNNGTSAVVGIPANFTGTATISVSAVNDCGTSAPRTLVLFAVAPDPSSAIQGPSNVTLGSTVTYSLPNGMGVTYTWVVPPNTQILSGQGSNQLTVKVPVNAPVGASGYIRVTVTNSCGSSPQGKKLVTIVSASKGTQPEIIASILKAYPNPTASTSTVVFSSAKQDSKYEIVVRDLAGKSLIRISGLANLGENQEVINLSSYANGMYLVTLITEDESRTLKLYRDK